MNALFQVTLTFPDENDNSLGFTLTSYYTLTTFYHTFSSNNWGMDLTEGRRLAQSDAYPVCIDTNPIPNITAALVLMGIMTIFQCTVFRVSHQNTVYIVSPC